MYEIGRQDANASALTVVLPLKWWARTYLVLWFGVLRLPWLRGWGFKTLDRQRFVSAIRWSVLPPFAPLGWSLHDIWDRPQDQRSQMLFESNFDGDWDEYLDTFGAVMPKPLGSIIWTGVGYPGLRTPALFKAYTRAHDHVPEHYVSAYRELTAGDIRQELVARDPGAGKAIAKEGFGRTSPLWTTFLMPIEIGRTGDAVRAARALEGDPDEDEQLLLTTGRIHFARLVVLQRRSGAWLLFTVTHDGPVEPVLEELVAADRDEAEEMEKETSRLRQLLECLVGVPDSSTGWWDDGRLVKFLLASRPAVSRHFVAYCAYPGSTVPLLRSFVEDAQRDTRWPSQEALS